MLRAHALDVDVMLERQISMYVTALGDSAVTLPCMGLITLWLGFDKATRHLAWRWLAFALGMDLLVALNKLAFMGWLISLPGLDFTGMSGHSVSSAVVWPALFGLLGRRHSALLQSVGIGLGLVLAWLIGWSRVVLHAHSVSEVVIGLAVGTCASLLFLWRHRAVWRLPERIVIATLSLILLLPFVYGHLFPSEALLKRTASYLSGHPPYRRADLHRYRQSQSSTVDAVGN